MTRYATGDVLLVRRPPLRNRQPEVHVAVVVLQDDGVAPYVVAAVGTSDDLDVPRQSIAWSRPAESRWVRGWPSGSRTTTHFYKRNVQEVPRHAIVREVESSTGKIGAVPQAFVDRIVALF